MGARLADLRNGVEVSVAGVDGEREEQEMRVVGNWKLTRRALEHWHGRWRLLGGRLGATGGS